MNKDIYKKAVDDIKADDKLIHDTSEKMINSFSSNKKSSVKSYIAIACSIFAVIMVITSYNLFPSFFNKNNKNKSNTYSFNNKKVQDPKQDLKSALAYSKNKLAAFQNTSVLPQVANNFVPFNATEYQEAKCPPPNYPLNYEDLNNKNNLVILCTVSNIGAYRDKSLQYNPRCSFGTLIYTVKIDMILSGKKDEKVGDLVPISEKAWAGPIFSNDRKEIVDWSFSPYTCRAKDALILEKGKQYVMILCPKDEKGLYISPYCGFGIFPLDYINNESEKNSLNQLEALAKNNQNPTMDLLYRICCLSVKEEYLK